MFVVFLGLFWLNYVEIGPRGRGSRASVDASHPNASAGWRVNHLALLRPARPARPRLARRMCLARAPAGSRAAPPTERWASPAASPAMVRAPACPRAARRVAPPNARL